MFNVRTSLRNVIIMDILIDGLEFCSYFLTVSIPSVCGIMVNKDHTLS